MTAPDIDALIARLEARIPRYAYDTDDVRVGATDLRTLLAELRRAREREGPALRDVRAERERQVNAEGWTHEHDDEHRDGSLAGAAACYALASLRDSDCGILDIAKGLWPWGGAWFKPCSSRRRELVKAGALILAEIERLDRLTPPQPESAQKLEDARAALEMGQ